MQTARYLFYHICPSVRPFSLTNAGFYASKRMHTVCRACHSGFLSPPLLQNFKANPSADEALNARWWVTFAILHRNTQKCLHTPCFIKNDPLLNCP